MDPLLCPQNPCNPSPPSPYLSPEKTDLTALLMLTSHAPDIDFPPTPQIAFLGSSSYGNLLIVRTGFAEDGKPPRVTHLPSVSRFWDCSIVLTTSNTWTLGPRAYYSLL